MYGLKQASRLAFDNIVKLLAPHVYLTVQESPGLWKNKNHVTMFTLCIDDFGIKSNSLDDEHHLLNVIKNFK